MRRTRGYLTQVLHLALVNPDECVETVDSGGFTFTADEPEARAVHAVLRNLLDVASAGHFHELHQHEHVGARRLDNHLLGTVGDFPLLRKVDSEPQDRMEKGAAARDALLWIFAVDDAVDALGERIAIGRKRPACRFQLLNGWLNLAYT